MWKTNADIEHAAQKLGIDAATLREAIRTNKAKEALQGKRLALDTSNSAWEHTFAEDKAKQDQANFDKEFGFKKDRDAWEREVHKDEFGLKREQFEHTKEQDQWTRTHEEEKAAQEQKNVEWKRMFDWVQARRAQANADRTYALEKDKLGHEKDVFTRTMQFKEAEAARDQGNKNRAFDQEDKKILAAAKKQQAEEAQKQAEFEWKRLQDLVKQGAVTMDSSSRALLNGKGEAVGRWDDELGMVLPVGVSADQYLEESAQAKRFGIEARIVQSNNPTTGNVDSYRMLFRVGDQVADSLEEAVTLRMAQIDAERKAKSNSKK